MSYERKPLQILGGGLNLLPPGDKTPTGDYLLAQNWRADRVGKLVGRYGYPLAFSISGAPYAHSAAIHGGASGDLYVGAGTALYVNGSSAQTGFDGGRLGLVPMNGWMWVCNKSKQGKHNTALGWNTWDLAAPATAPVGTPAANWGPPSANPVTYNTALQGTTYRHYLSVNATFFTNRATTASAVLNFDAVSFPHVNPSINGMPVIGAGIPAGTTVVSATSTTVTLSSTVTVAAGTCITFGNYWFLENGYAAGQLALTLATCAGSDPYVTAVSSGYDLGGTPYKVTITPSASNIIIIVSGSDSNPTVSLCNGSISSSLPYGTYRIWQTFLSSDLSTESNPGPPSVAVNVYNAAIQVSALAAPVDSSVGYVNLYMSGGSLPDAYLVASMIPSTVGSPATVAGILMPDTTAVSNGDVMSITNDPAPAAAGIVGPYLGRAYAFCTTANPNRLFYSSVEQPQYFPGSGNPDRGNWVDVGLDAEPIVWCTIHSGALIIYKQRSIWRLRGDPETGTLDQITDSIGLANAFAVAVAGQVDYFVGPRGLYRNTIDDIQEVTGPVVPVFEGNAANGGALTPIGAALNYLTSDSAPPNSLSVGYGAGHVYVSYYEKRVSGSGWVMLVFNEQTGKYFYHRNGLNIIGFQGFLFNGINVLGLTGDGSSHAYGYVLDDFRAFGTTDPSSTPIECVMQTRYEDVGQPDNQKCWIEVVIDFEFSGDTATVYAGYDTGSVSLTSLGTISGTGRQQKSFPLNSGDGVLAKNISIAIDCSSSSQSIIHNVYLYYYVEARLAAGASTLPTDLGSAKIKQAKELELDINASGGAVAAKLWSDLPGNVLALRQTATVAANSGRAILKFPFSVVEGYLWKLTLAAAANPFRLYSARLLMRVMGTYIEAYEAAAGFVWDSMEHTFESGLTHISKAFAISLAMLPIKRAREIRLQIDTYGGDVTLTLLTDLPGDAQAVRFTTTVNSGSVGRRFVNVPLPAGTNAPIEGRLFRLQLSGASKFVLYDIAMEILAVGVYLEASETGDGAVYDSRELDFGSLKPKEARELELDIETTGSITATLYSDMPAASVSPGALQQVFQSPGVATSGRQTVRLPLTVAAATEVFANGRQFRLILSGNNAFRLYGARLSLREFGMFLTSDEASGGGLWDSTPLDLTLQRPKSFKRLQVDLTTGSSPVTVTVLTDQSGTLAPVYTTTAVTSSVRKAVTLTLPPGTRGTLVQVQISGAGAALYGAKIWWRPLNDSKAGWAWTPLPVPPTAPEWVSSPFPVNPTEPQWFWAKLLSVEETSESWTWVDVPFEVTGS